MEEEKRSPDEKFNRYTLGWILIGVVGILAIIVFGVAVIFLAGEDGPQPWMVGVLFGILGVLIVVMLIYGVFYGRAEREMVQQLLYWEGTEIRIKTIMDIQTFSGQRRIKTPVTFSETGFAWENQFIGWDKLQGTVGYMGNGGAGQPAWYIRLYSAEAGVVLYFWPRVKNYALVRRFCKSYIEGMPSVDEACRKLVDPARPLPPLPQKPQNPRSPSNDGKGTGGDQFGMQA